MKKNRIYTRKGRALRLIAILLIILTIGHITGTYFFLPGQALDKLVKKEAVGEVEVIKVLYDQDLEPAPMMRYYLCGNDNVLMLCGTRFHPIMGWYYQFAAQVPLAGNDPVKACYQTFSRDGEPQKLYMFGRVDDEDAAAVNIEARYHCDDIADTRSVYMQINRESFITHGGKRYFLMEMNSLVHPEEYYPELDHYFFNGIFTEVIDSDGNAISFESKIDAEGETETSRRIDHYSHTYLG